MNVKSSFLGLLLMVCSVAVPAQASCLGDIRVNARFLTDRMAFELNLTPAQYDDLYEINYDFFYYVDPYVAAIARSEAYALDAYYRYLDERNDDLRWILSQAEYLRFMALEHFFRPIYALNNLCYLRVYQVYPNHSFFYYGRPAHYYSYCGGHSRHSWGGSFYRSHYPHAYKHTVYHGAFRSRSEHRRDDFVSPRPGKHGGYHFTPAQSTRPGKGQDRVGVTTRPTVSSKRPSQEVKRSPNATVRRSTSAENRRSNTRVESRKPADSKTDVKSSSRRQTNPSRQSVGTSRKSVSPTKESTLSSRQSAKVSDRRAGGTTVDKRSSSTRSTVRQNRNRQEPAQSANRSLRRM